MPLESDRWFNEECKEGGSAFSLRVTQKLHSESTEYQTIDIYETETFGNLMVIDGYVMLTSRDNFLYHEMMAHPAIYSHPNPKNVVIIGGGDCGTLQEVLKHEDIESAWQVEIDERVTRLAEEYFPELCTSNDDPRAHFYFGDGIAWMKQAQAGSIDIIIIDSSEPVGPGEGLFSKNFYHDCYQALADKGIIVHQSESPLLHLDMVIKPMYQDMKNAGFKAIQTLQYPQPCYPSGWWSATMAVKNGRLETFRQEAAAQKVFDTKYYNAEMHVAAKVQPEFVKAALREFE